MCRAFRGPEDTRAASSLPGGRNLFRENPLAEGHFSGDIRHENAPAESVGW